jgi:hypothetical protein
MQIRSSLSCSQEPLDSNQHSHFLKPIKQYAPVYPQVSLKVFLTNVFYAYLNPYMRAVRKTSMILHFKYLMKFKVLQLFIMRSVINFCNSVKMCECNKWIPTTWRVQYQTANLNSLPRGIFEMYLLLQILSTFTVHAISLFQKVQEVYILYHLFS